MKLIVIKIVVKIFLFALVLWMFIFSVFFVGMDTNMKDGKANCLFGGHPEVICKMNPMEDIQEWQSMFTTLPAKDALFYLFTLVVFIFFVFQKFWNKFSIHNTRLLFSQPIYVLRDSFQVFDPIQEAFSSGILNPKSF